MIYFAAALWLLSLLVGAFSVAGTYELATEQGMRAYAVGIALAGFLLAGQLAALAHITWMGALGV